MRLHSRNVFSFAIVVGDLFANPNSDLPAPETDISSLLRGKIDIPLPTYFALGKHPLPQQVIDQLDASTGELCPNLYFLDKRSVTKTSEGIRIVNLAGRLDSTVLAGESKDRYLPFYTENDAKTLRGAKTADILITSDWPASIHSGSKVNLPEGTDTNQGEQCIADLCATLKPRYHFTTSTEGFYEREPFFHLDDAEPDIRPITRFISLASFDNQSKQKSIYAFSLDPNASSPTMLPAGTTPSPFALASRKRQRLPEQDDSYTRFSRSDIHHNGGSKRMRRKYQPPPTPSECFFCLSNNNVAKHMLTSIADDTYLTIAKGPLTTASTYPSLACPSHILIMPVAHSATFGTLDVSSRASTFKEMQRYRRALHSMLVSQSKRELGAVTWEISRADGIHFHWQFLPVPSELIKKGLVEAAFRVEAENEKYPLLKAKEIGDGSVEKRDYFRIWIWRPEDADSISADIVNGDANEENVGKEKSLVLPITDDYRFDLQFGRKVMAKLLHLEGRLSWRDCAQTEEEEDTDAKAFKKVFKRFDWSLKED